MSTKYSTNGVIFIHSVTPPLQKHVEWALTNVLGYEVTSIGPANRRWRE